MGYERASQPDALDELREAALALHEVKKQPRHLSLQLIEELIKDKTVWTAMHIEWEVLVQQEISLAILENFVRREEYNVLTTTLSTRPFNIPGNSVFILLRFLQMRRTYTFFVAPLSLLVL